MKTNAAVAPASRSAAPAEAGPAAAPGRRRRKEARPQELLDAALDLFAQRGFAATRSEDVAARAGVSKGTLYLYYPSKEELLKEVIRHHVINPMAEGVQLLRECEGRTPALLETMLRLWWQRVGETRASEIIKLMTSEAGNFPDIAQFYADEVVTPSHQMLAQVIQRGIDRGEFRPVDVRQVTHALTGPLVFMALNKHSLGACGVALAVDPREVIDALLDMVLNGLVPRPAPGAAKTPRRTRPGPAGIASEIESPPT